MLYNWSDWRIIKCEYAKLHFNHLIISPDVHSDIDDECWAKFRLTVNVAVFRHAPLQYGRSFGIGIYNAFHLKLWKCNEIQVSVNYYCNNRSDEFDKSWNDALNKKHNERESSWIARMLLKSFGKIKSNLIYERKNDRIILR